LQIALELQQREEQPLFVTDFGGEVYANRHLRRD
jgi:hypothetical protein